MGKDDLSKEPGNFGDPTGWASTGLGGQGSYSLDMRNKELNNGRAAMFSIMGIMVAELVTGKDGVQQLGLPRAGCGPYGPCNQDFNQFSKVALRSCTHAPLGRTALRCCCSSASPAMLMAGQDECIVYPER